MEKEFDRWNERKKVFNASDSNSRFFYYEQEIWWCAVGANVGVEIDGKHKYFERPVLVVKKFNRAMFWGVPFTSGARDYEPYFGGKMSWAVLSQLRLMDRKRLIRKLHTMGKSHFAAVRRALARSLQ